MSRQEKRKWAFAGILSVVLGCVLWFQYGASGASRERGQPTRRAPRQNSSTATSEGAAPIRSRLPLPGNVEALCRVNPFDSSAIQPASLVDGHGASKAPEPAPDPLAAVPEWLRNQPVQGTMRIGEQVGLIIGGRLIREGDIVDGVEIVRIDQGKLWVRPVLSEGISEGH